MHVRLRLDRFLFLVECKYLRVLVILFTSIFWSNPSASSGLVT